MTKFDKRTRTTGNHRIHDIAWNSLRFGVIAQREPTTGYWMAWCGPNDGEYTTIVYFVDASFDTKRLALDALLDVMAEDLTQNNCSK